MKRHFPDFKKIISTKDAVAKIICVLLAIILWFIINSTNIFEIKFKIPITFLNLPDNLVKTEVSDNYVTVALKGRKDNIKNVNVKSLKAIVNLEHPSIDVRREYPIEISREEIPENINIKLSVKAVALKVERKVSKKVSIKANIILKVKNSFVLGRIKVIPEIITINGPESIVKEINYLQTEKITLINARTKIIEKDVQIDSKDLPEIYTDIKKVRVFIPVIDSANLAEFKKKIVLKYNNDKYKYTLTQGEVSVYLRPDNPGIRPLEDDIIVYVDVDLTDLDDFVTDSNKKYIEKIFPVNATIRREGIKTVSIFPDIVSVKISAK